MNASLVFFAGPILATGVAWSLASPSLARDDAPPGEDLARVCARLGTDDAIRPYTPALRERTIRASQKIAPRAEADDRDWQTQAHYRCYHGKVLVCFVGANLPCAKINTARANPGADAFCRANPKATTVPAVATGHDAAYSYKCREGHAEVDRATWQLDSRGYAQELWTVLPER